MALALDFETDITGVYVMVQGGEPLGSGCLTDDQVDFQISRLKGDLDRLAAAMKEALREHLPQPLEQG